MKIKNYILALVCLFMFNYSFATGNHYTTWDERTENWLKKAPAATTDESATGGRTDGNQPTDDPSVPLGDPLFAVLLLSGVYIAFLTRKQILAMRSVRVKN